MGGVYRDIPGHGTGICIPGMGVYMDFTPYSPPHYPPPYQSGIQCIEVPAGPRETNTRRTCTCGGGTGSTRGRLGLEVRVYGFRECCVLITPLTPVSISSPLPLPGHPHLQGKGCLDRSSNHRVTREGTPGGPLGVGGRRVGGAIGHVPVSPGRIPYIYWHCCVPI